MVYPCVYREHNEFNFISVVLFGLSLCIQGTLECNNGQGLTSRFIPVYTGNTLSEYSLFNSSPVYPCVYREHIFILFCNANSAGLSLCIQGTQFKLVRLIICRRFIPVYTGNTHGLVISIVSVPVYPCVYREHSNYNILFYN